MEPHEKQLETAQQELKQPPEPPWKTAFWVAWDSVFAWLKITAVGKHIKEVEIRYVRKVPVILISTLVLGAIGGCWMRDSSAKKNEVVLVTNYSITNSRLAGALTESSNQTQRLERQLDKNKQEHSAEVLQLKLDFQEAKREKDVEILKLAGERDAAKHDLAQFQAIPANFLTIYADLTNAAKLYIQDPQTTRQLGRIESLATNLLSSMQQPSPKFSVTVDGVALPDATSATVMHPMKAGELKIAVNNIGSITAEHLIIELLAPLDSTNVIAQGWQLQASFSGKFVLLDQTNEVANVGHWLVEAQTSIPNEESFICPGFTILTNASGRQVPITINVHADRTKLQRFGMTLLLLPGG